MDAEEKPYGGRGRDGREAATSPGTDARSPRSWKRWEDPPLEPLQGAQPWDPLTSDVWSPGLGEDGCLGFQAPRFVALCCRRWGVSH